MSKLNWERRREARQAERDRQAGDPEQALIRAAGDPTAPATRARSSRREGWCGVITYDDLERRGACCRGEGERYSREVLDARLGAGWSLSLAEVLALEWVHCFVEARMAVEENR